MFGIGKSEIKAAVLAVVAVAIAKRIPAIAKFL